MRDDYVSATMQHLIDILMHHLMYKNILQEIFSLDMFGNPYLNNFLPILFIGDASSKRSFAH